MNIKDYKFNKELYTAEDLTNYIGYPIYLWYSFADAESVDTALRLGLNPNDERFSWVTQLKVIKCRDSIKVDPTTHVSNLDLYGKYTLYNMRVSTLISGNNIKELEWCLVPANGLQLSNAQTHIRTLTREEFKLYKNLTRKKRLFGK